MKYSKILSIILIVLSLYACSEKTKYQMLKDGVALKSNGNYYGAIVLFKNALERDENFYEARYELADTYLSLQKFEKAEMEFKKVRLQDPSYPGLKLKFAKLIIFNHHPDKAIAEIKDYIAKKGKDDGALNLLGESYAQKGDMESAEKEFKAAIEKGTSTLGPQLNLCRIYIKQGKTDEAEALAKSVVLKNPGNKKANSILGQLEAKLGHFDEALKIYRNLENLYPSDPKPFYMEGLILASLGKIKECDKVAELLNKKFPKTENSYKLNGILFYKKNRYEDAIVSLQKCNQINTTLTTLFFLGETYEKTGRLELALNQFQKLLDYKPNFIPARVMVAMILLKQHRYDDSINEVKIALEDDPENALGHQVLGSNYLAKRMFDKAMKEFNEAIRFNPNLVAAHFEKGILALAGGDTKSAESQLSRAVILAPAIPGTRLALGSFYLRQENYSAAIKTLNKGLCGKETDALFYNNLAVAYFAQEKPEAAIKALHSAKRSNPDYFAPYYNLGNFYAANADFKAAFKEYREVLKIDSHNMKALLLCGLTCELMQDHKNALEFYKKAKNTNKIGGYVGLANYYQRNNNFGDAVKVIEEYMKKTQDDIKILGYLGNLYFKMGKYQESIKAYSRLERALPGLALGPIADIYIKIGKKEEAIENLNQYISKNKHNITGYIVLSDIYMKIGKKQNAINVLNNAKNYISQKRALKLKKASIYQNIGEYDLSIGIYREILEKQPKNYAVLFSLGALYDQMGQKGKARKLYQQVLDISKNYTPALNNLAYLYVENYGEIDEALELAMKAFRNDPWNPNVLDTLGYVLLKKGRAGEAVHLLKKAASLLGDNPIVVRHLALAYKALGEGSVADRLLKNARKPKSLPDAIPLKGIIEKLSS